MGIARTVKERLTRERDAGKTFQAIADKYHVTQPYVVNLANGKSQYDNITLGVLDRMFPHAQIDLEGCSIVASRVSSPGDGDITYSSGDRSESLRAAIISALVDLDLPGDTLKIVLKTVKNTEA